MIHRFALLALPLLAGCATEDVRTPSLGVRPAEGHGFEEPAAPPPAVATPDPALDARIARLTADAAEQRQAFEDARSAAEAKVAAASGAAPGSEGWLDAQVALGGLDVARAATSERATALEQLAADRAVAGEPPYPALDAALAAARADLAAAEETIAALNERLRR